MQRPTMPTPSMAVSVTALVVALGGTSYAAATIGSAGIKDNSVRSKDVRANTLTSGDVRNGSLKARDFDADDLPAGPAGPKGDTGATGPAGPAGPSRWVLVDATGAIEAQSGGFTVKSGYGANPPGAAGNVYIDAGEDLSDNGIVATIALQNQADQNGDMVMNGRAPLADANPEFSGEISATRCAIAGVVACAPEGTNTSTHFVVSPRLSDGQVTDATNRKRFYVVVSGS